MQLPRTKSKNAKRPPSKPRYQRGQEVGTFRVMKPLGRVRFSGGFGRMDSCWLYEADCLRCGTRYELSQVRLRRHERTGKSICPECRKRAEAKARAETGRRPHVSCAADALALWKVPPSVLRGPAR